MSTDGNQLNRLSTRTRQALTRSSAPIEIAAMEGGLRAQIEEVQVVSEQPQATVWRRALLLWVRIYQYEKVPGRKAKMLNLRIPLPLPLVGLFFHRRLTWEQALNIVRMVRRQPLEEEMIEPYLASCMAMEFLRIEEEKAEKKELLVIGLD